MPKVIDLAIKNIPRIESDNAVVDALQLMLLSNTTILFLYDDNMFRGPICSGNLSGYPLTRLLLDCPCSPFVFINDNEPMSTVKDIFHEAGNKYIVVKDSSGEPLGLIETSSLITTLCNKGNDLCSALFSSFCKLPEKQQKVSPVLDQFSDEIASLGKMATIGQISAGIAHDTNNLLGTIMGHAELALLEPDNDPSKEQNSHARRHLETILSSVTQCSKLLSPLISISRPSNAPVSAEIADVHEMCLDTIGLLHSSMQHSFNVSFTHHFDASESRISCIKSQFLNALINLCLNARDAMPSGGNIDLATSNSVLQEPHGNIYGFSIAKGSYIIISITDNGKGIPQEVLPLLFQPYFTTKAKGTGLGLSNVYQTILELHGLVDVDSIVNSGTTFKIYIPALSGHRDGKQ